MARWTPYLKPLVKWPGGKSWLVPTLIETYWADRRASLDSPDRRLVEPFAGGLSFALGLRPARAMVNDLNPHLMNLYRQVRNGLVIDPKFWRPDDGRTGEERYYLYRDLFNRLVARREDDTCDAAALFLYLNKHGYNGLCRFNRKGEFNVPWGGDRQVDVPDLAPYRRLLQRWVLKSTDFANLHLAPGDFVYIDPPYDDGFVGYNKHAWTWEDQVRIVDWLADHEGPVLISNKATERIEDLYRRNGFAVLYVDGPRRISRDGDRTPVREVLAHRGLHRDAASELEREVTMT